MEFIDVTGDTDASCTSLDRAYTPPVQKKRKPSRTSEDDAKIELWKPLAASLKPQDNVIAKKWIVRTCHFIWKGCRRFSFEICPKGVVLFEKEGDDVFYDYEQHKSISHSTYPNSPSYLANQFIQENNLQPAHFMNMFSNVSNNGMQMNQYSHTKTSISQNNEFYPFSPVSTCLNDSYWYFKHTVKKKHCYEFLYYIITVLYQFDSFSQRVGLVDIKGHYYFLMLFFLWKMQIKKYLNLPVNVTVRLPHPRSGNSQVQETFLEPSADKKTSNYDTECSNHHPSLSTLRSKGLRYKFTSVNILSIFIPLTSRICSTSGRIRI